MIAIDSTHTDLLSIANLWSAENKIQSSLNPKRHTEYMYIGVPMS